MYEQDKKDWQYYNHAIIPNCPPHEMPDLTSVKDRSIWKTAKTAFLVRYTSDYDCKFPTKWWYVIKDTPFDINSLKAKRRYEINKGIRNFDVIRLNNPSEFAADLCEIQIEAFSVYPKKYRPMVDRKNFIESVNSWSCENCYVYGAFNRKDNSLCGYAYLTEDTSVINFNVLKTRPESEKYAINAALVYKILLDFNYKLDNSCYICDGARSISHETAFQDYLEKYFGFRKAFCQLHVVFNPKYKWIILFLYRFRSIFRKLDPISFVHKMNGIFMMYEITNQQKN